MKRMNYQAPSLQFLSVSTADVITASKIFLDEDGVIEMKEYEFEGA